MRFRGRPSFLAVTLLAFLSACSSARRAALKVERTRIAVWDDESAWRANSADTASDGFIEHKRAIYLKDPSSPDPVERFLVFGKSGTVVYERDFRSYPLTELD